MAAVRTRSRDRSGRRSLGLGRRWALIVMQAVLHRVEEGRYDCRFRAIETIQPWSSPIGRLTTITPVVHDAGLLLAGVRLCARSRAPDTSPGKQTLCVNA